MAAEGFAEGAAGIVLPQAEPVPDGYLVDSTMATRDITADEVADALADVRRALIAARLDRRTLVDHDPDPYLWTQARGAGWQTWFDPHIPVLPGHDFYRSPAFARVATLLGRDTGLAAEPRMGGRVSYRPAITDWGVPIRVLEVAARFVWVYALEVTGHSSTAIVVIRSETVWEMSTDYRFESRYNEGLHLVEAGARAWGADCQTYEETGRVRPAATGTAGAIADAVFDPDQPLEPIDGCRPGTG